MPTRIPRNWHKGELLAQQQRDFQDAAFGVYEGYQPGLNATDPAFFPSLNILPLTTLDEERRPWVSVLTAKSGQRGFIRFGRGLGGEDMLRIRSNCYERLPLKAVLEKFGKDAENEEEEQGEVLVASVGVEFTNRRRNKFAGQILRVGFVENDETEFDLEVFHSFGNCPKYINVRHLVGPASIQPTTLGPASLHLDSSLPDEALEIIDQADFVWLGTRHTASQSQELSWGQEDHDSLGCNHRGGSAGFVRTFFDEEKGRTCVVLPDFSGNRLMMSFGNIQGENDGVAGLTIPKFGYAEDPSTSTSILHLTGDARVVNDKEAQKYVRGIKSCLLVWVTGYSIVDHVPLVIGRLEKEEEVERTLSEEEKRNLTSWSPYNPPVKKLINEKLVEGSREAILASAPKTEATLVRAQLLSDELGVFTFRAPLQLSTGGKLSCEAGQHIIVDASPALEFRVTSYRHMATKGQEKELNDDGVRSWTVTSTREVGDEFEFSLTLRKVQQGAVTPTIFWQGQRLLKEQPNNSPEASSKTYVLPEDPLKFPLLGIAGEMNLKFDSSSPLKLLYLTSGIGITPFLAHLRQVSGKATSSKQDSDILAILACREGEATLLQKLVQDALSSSASIDDKGAGKIKVQIQMLTRGEVQDQDQDQDQAKVEVEVPSNVVLGFEILQNVRLSDDYFSEGDKGNSFSSIQDREVYICGTNPFEKVAREALSRVGVDAAKIHYESFSF